MGCEMTREKLEDKMIEIKLRRMEIVMEKDKELKNLAQMLGKSVKKTYIPDYIDPKFAKEMQIESYDDEKVIEYISKKNKRNKCKNRKY